MISQKPFYIRFGLLVTGIFLFIMFMPLNIFVDAKPEYRQDCDSLDSSWTFVILCDIRDQNDKLIKQNEILIQQNSIITSLLVKQNNIASDPIGKTLPLHLGGDWWHTKDCKYFNLEYDECFEKHIKEKATRDWQHYDEWELANGVKCYGFYNHDEPHSMQTDIRECVWN